jgi:hypothetical protein
MRRFRLRPDPLERRLRDERPQPSDDLVDRITASVERRRPAPRPAFNFAVAFALTVALFTALAFTGGVSYAASAAQKGAKAVSHIVVTNHTTHSTSARSNKSDDNDKSHKSGGSKKSKKGNKGDDEHGNGNNGHHGDDQGDDDDDEGPDDDQYREKVLICHHPGKHQHTIRVSQSAVAAHLAQGDTLGPCPKKHNDD